MVRAGVKGVLVLTLLGVVGCDSPIINSDALSQGAGGASVSTSASGANGASNGTTKVADSASTPSASSVDALQVISVNEVNLSPLSVSQSGGEASPPAGFSVTIVAAHPTLRNGEVVSLGETINLKISVPPGDIANTALLGKLQNCLALANESLFRQSVIFGFSWSSSEAAPQFFI